MAAIIAFVLYYLFVNVQEYPDRGYTELGYGLGIAAVIIMLIVLAYSLRKRRGQEKLPGGMQAWLWGHITLGVLAIVIVGFHAGWHFTDGASYLDVFGNISVALLFIVVVSGILGRVFYAVIPGAASKNVHDLRMKETLGSIEKQEAEMERLSAGKSTAFKYFCERVVKEGRNKDLSPDWQTASGMLPQEESQDFLQVKQVLLERYALQTRYNRQKFYKNLLNGWRYAHIPLTLALFAAIGTHLFFLFHFGKPTAADYSVAENCASCHPTQYSEWLQSQHANAQISPTNIFMTTLTLDPKIHNELGFVAKNEDVDFCIRCHAPIGNLLDDGSGKTHNDRVAPLTMDDGRNNVSVQGITCVVCHTISNRNGGNDANFSPSPGAASGNFIGQFGSGGANDPPSLGNDFHSGSSSSFITSSQFCETCHEVTRADGIPLQRTYAEWLLTPFNDPKNPTNCQDCHMRNTPGRPGQMTLGQAAADNAQYGIDGPLPVRYLSNHSFIGSDFGLLDDYPYNGVIAPKSGNAQADQQANQAVINGTLQQRKESLTGMATVQVQGPGQAQESNGNLNVGVTVTNTQVGHELPAGFSFERELWLHVVAKDSTGKVIFESGDFGPDGDLRDIISTEYQKRHPDIDFATHCGPVDLNDPYLDKFLVNFQSQLICIGSDGKPYPVINPLIATGLATFGLQYDKPQTVSYPIPVSGVKGPITVTVELKFRNLNPYLLNYMQQATGASQSDINEYEKKLADNIIVVNSQTVTFNN